MYIYSVLFVLYIYKQFNVHPKLRIANVLLLKFGGGGSCQFRGTPLSHGQGHLLFDII